MPLYFDNHVSDKVFLEFGGPFPINKMLEYIVDRKTPTTRHYKSHFRIKLPNDAIIQVFTKHLHGYQVQINPTHFKSWHDVHVVVKFLFGTSHHISSLHLYLDIAYEPEIIMRGISLSKLRKHFIYEDPSECTKTLYFGSAKAVQLKVYDAAKKHNLSGPLTRIEWSFKGADRCPISSIFTIGKLHKDNRFGDVVIKGDTFAIPISKVDRVKADHFKLKKKRWARRQQSSISKKTIPTMNVTLSTLRDALSHLTLT